MEHNPTLDVIFRRRSTRAYDPGPVDDALVETILEAGFAAPFAQLDSLHFSVVSQATVLNRVNLAAKEVARGMEMLHIAALGAKESYHCLYHAPMAILICARQGAVAGDGDAAAATQNMLLAAESLGLAACWIYFGIMGFVGPQGSMLRMLCDVPESFVPKAWIALGHPARALSGEEPGAKGPPAPLRDKSVRWVPPR